ADRAPSNDLPDRNDNKYADDFLAGLQGPHLSSPAAMPNRASAVLPGHDEQHRGPLIVETDDLAGLDLQRTPVSGTCINGSQPVQRCIIVISVERVAPLGVAGLVACEEIARGLQRAPDPRDNIGKFYPRHMKQAGIGPDRVIRIDRVEVM